jgi:hypothetical protein
MEFAQEYAIELALEEEDQSNNENN